MFFVLSFHLLIFRCNWQMMRCDVRYYMVNDPPPICQDSGSPYISPNVYGDRCGKALPRKRLSMMRGVNPGTSEVSVLNHVESYDYRFEVPEFIAKKHSNEGVISWFSFSGEAKSFEVPKRSLKKLIKPQPRKRTNFEKKIDRHPRFSASNKAAFPLREKHPMLYAVYQYSQTIL